MRALYRVEREGGGWEMEKGEKMRGEREDEGREREKQGDGRWFERVMRTMCARSVCVVVWCTCERCCKGAAQEVAELSYPTLAPPLTSLVIESPPLDLAANARTARSLQECARSNVMPGSVDELSNNDDARW